MLFEFKIMKHLVSLALGMVLCATSAFGTVKVFYTAKQKTFEVTEFSGGFPKVGEIVEGDEFENNAWKVVGELPLAPEMVAATLAYRVIEKPRFYKDRHRSRKARVQFEEKRILSKLPWDISSTDLIVFGWVDEDVVSKIAVTASNTDRKYGRGFYFEIDESEFDGYPLVWLLRKGEAVSRGEVAYPELAAMRRSGGKLKDLKKPVRSRKAENSALHYAAANGNLDTVRRLLELEVRIDAVNGADETPLMKACSNGRSEVAAYLLSQGSRSHLESDANRTALQLAAEHGHNGCIESIFESEKKIRKGDRDAALLIALRADYEESALLLFERGGTVNFNKDKVSDIAFSNYGTGMVRLAEYLLDRFGGARDFSVNGSNFLHAVAPYADVELLEAVASAGAEIGLMNSMGFTPMDGAVAHGNVPAICWFIENGGNPSDRDGRVNPLTHAIMKDQPSSVSCLASYGFDINQELKPGVTPLMTSVLFERKDIAELIVDHGGVCDVESDFADAYVAKAIEMDSPKIAQSLLEQGWETDRLAFNLLSLAEVAHFYRSDSVVDQLEELGFEGGLRDMNIRNVDTKPTIISRSEIEYGRDLQEKFGDINAKFSILLSEFGVPALFRFEEETPQEIRTLITSEVSRWRFSPAKRGDQAVPVALSLKMPFKATLLSEIFDAGDVTIDVKPKPLLQVRPYYPSNLKFSGIEGFVVVEWVILPDGSVIRPRAVRSSHIEFEGPAIASIRASKWKAGEVRGTKVAVRVRQRVDFTF